MFDVLMIGVGDAFSRRHWGTNFWLRCGDFTLAVDCPDSYRRALQESGLTHNTEPLDVHHLGAMWLTHLHGDHVNGLEMTACYMRFAHQRRLKLYTSPDVAPELWPRLAPSLKVLWDGQTFHPQRLEDFLEVEVVPWEQPTTIGPFTIESRPTRHHLRATALRVSDGTHTLGYSCDTAYDEALLAWLEPCDLIIHESSLGAAHTPLEKLLALPEATQRKMLVVHYPDELIGAELGALRLAQQGAIYGVGAPA